MANQGKCMPCGVVYEWQKSLVLTKSECPECGKQLQTTNKRSPLPRISLLVQPKAMKTG
ncbi:TPA: hypothetical protein ACGXM3_005394 [Bacillus cereus]